MRMSYCMYDHGYYVRSYCPTSSPRLTSSQRRGEASGGRVYEYVDIIERVVEVDINALPLFDTPYRYAELVVEKYSVWSVAEA
jgi:hypothetical protein